MARSAIVYSLGQASAERQAHSNRLAIEVTGAMVKFSITIVVSDRYVGLTSRDGGRCAVAKLRGHQNSGVLAKNRFHLNAGERPRGWANLWWNHLLVKFRIATNHQDFG